ncbi:ArnT family glycosyltransferase [Sphingomonas sp. M1A8_2b]
MPRNRWVQALILLLVALAVRAWDFGNPVIEPDQQYYLLVGDRLLHGAVPYIDIWDRKPIGLFLLFAGLRTLPGNGILAYQLAATLCAWATAIVVVRAARTIGANDRGALAAGVSYLLFISLVGGSGGQAPVFYNLPMAVAALLTLHLPAKAAAGRTRAIVWSGFAACLFGGIAIQLKYTPMFEGAVFGLAHVWFLRRAGARWRHVLLAAAIWALMGLAPTLAAIGWYRAQGQAAFDAFWFANFTSIALRRGYSASDLAMRLLGIIAQLSPLVLGAVLSWRARPRGGVAGETVIVGYAWLGFALAGFFAIGTFFDHYSLPLIAPLAILAAPTLGRSIRMLGLTLAVAIAILLAKRVLHPSDAAGAYRVAHVVAANSGTECPYVFIGDTITYHLAHACLPTAYAFPNLLAYDTEQGATGINEATEVRRILATRPPVIVTSDRRLSIWNRGSLHAVKAALARDYRPVFTTRRNAWHTIVYLRNDRPFRP